jgi:hypothetical protein
MPVLSAKDYLPDARGMVASQAGLDHVRVRARGDLLILESGPEADPVRHARFRRITRQDWTLEMPARGGRWDPTGMRDTLRPLFELLVGAFGWMLTPIADENPDRT